MDADAAFGPEFEGATDQERLAMIKQRMDETRSGLEGKAYPLIETLSPRANGAIELHDRHPELSEDR
jgi:hypothetical protein